MWECAPGSEEGVGSTAGGSLVLSAPLPVKALPEAPSTSRCPNSFSDPTGPSCASVGALLHRFDIRNPRRPAEGRLPRSVIFDVRVSIRLRTEPDNDLDFPVMDPRMLLRFERFEESEVSADIWGSREERGCRSEPDIASPSDRLSFDCDTGMFVGGAGAGGDSREVRWPIL